MRAPEAALLGPGAVATRAQVLSGPEPLASFAGDRSVPLLGAESWLDSTLAAGQAALSMALAAGDGPWALLEAWLAAAAAAVIAGSATSEAT